MFVARIGGCVAGGGSGVAVAAIAVGVAVPRIDVDVGGSGVGVGVSGIGVGIVLGGSGVGVAAASATWVGPGALVGVSGPQAQVNNVPINRTHSLLFMLVPAFPFGSRSSLGRCFQRAHALSPCRAIALGWQDRITGGGTGRRSPVLGRSYGSPGGCAVKNVVVSQPP